MNKSKSTLSWFELPVVDLSRATKFYERMLATSLKRQAFGGGQLAVFPYEPPALGGALISSERKPSADGAVIYLDAGGDIDGCLARVKDAGGEVVMPRTAIDVHGYIAMVRDTEGNVVGLHQERNA